MGKIIGLMPSPERAPAPVDVTAPVETAEVSETAEAVEAPAPEETEQLPEPDVKKKKSSRK